MTTAGRRGKGRSNACGSDIRAEEIYHIEATRTEGATVGTDIVEATRSWPLFQYTQQTRDSFSRNLTDGVLITHPVRLHSNKSPEVENI